MKVSKSRKNYRNRKQIKASSRYGFAIYAREFDDIKKRMYIIAELQTYEGPKKDSAQ